MLTKSDLKAIRDVFSEEFSKNFKKAFDKSFPQAFNESFSEARKTLKDDLITFKDQILTEIKKLREEVAVVIGYKDQIEDHETRIEKLEGVLEPNN